MMMVMVMSVLLLDLLLHRLLQLLLRLRLRLRTVSGLRMGWRVSGRPTSAAGVGSTTPLFATATIPTDFSFGRLVADAVIVRARICAMNNDCYNGHQMRCKLRDGHFVGNKTSGNFPGNVLEIGKV